MIEKQVPPSVDAVPAETGPPQPELTFVIPVFDESGCIKELYSQLNLVSQDIKLGLEILFVDDGSTDGSDALLDAIAANDPRVAVIHFRRNYGKSAALDAAFRLARGDIIITLDADLQDDPAEIPRFLAKLDEGYDVVSGWKRTRHDPLSKTLPSRLFNWFTRKVSGLALHDFNSGFKAYRRECLAQLRLYGELHRYIPVVLHWEGFRIGEMEVTHRPRLAGKSKFGSRRLITGAFDLMTVVLTSKFRHRPLHFFGYAAVVLGLIGGLALAWLFALSVTGLDPLRPRPLLYASILLLLTSVSLIATGLLGELIKSLSPYSNEYHLRPTKSGKSRHHASDDHAG